MKWDWGMFGAVVARVTSAVLDELGAGFEVLSEMLSQDHDFRMEQKEWVNAVGEAINSLPEVDE